ncbi:hypothetical protein BDV18DRAFT_144360 [Aspergillus unguis]
MGRSDKDISTKTNPGPFYTPDKPASSSKLRRAPARLGSLAATPGPTSTSSPSIASTARSGKRNSSKFSRDQTTLTQIEFVRRPDSDDDLDYIDDSGRDTGEVIEIEDDEVERDNGRDLEYKPLSASRRKSNRAVRFDSAPPKLQKKSSVLSDVSSGRGRRKSGEKKAKEGQRDDNTLTQMKYVQRIDLAGPDFDDAKLEYAYITPKKREAERQPVNSGTANGFNPASYMSEPTSERKRIKLSPVSEPNGVQKFEQSPERKLKPSPTTPRNSTRTEIPSSQSPESPGIAFMTSSQFRNATQLLEKREQTPSNEPHIKKEFTGSSEPMGPSKAVQLPYVDEKQPLGDPKPLFPPTAQQELAEITPNATSTEKSASDITIPPNPSQRPAASQRTVVYETDAESDYGDFDDDLADVPSSPGGKDTADPGDKSQGENETIYPDTESQELPPPPVPQNDTNSGPFPSQSNIQSDASICYQRLYPDTQFPLEPVPTINTQKMAELFPEESNGLRTISPTPSSSPQKTRKAPAYSMIPQTQDLEDGQVASQNLVKRPTEIIPESSPVAHHEGSASLNRHVPAAMDVVVQVESSQPADRARRQSTLGNDSAPRHMLTRSQILTSSVMESVPMPAFWLSSQDSVGEPYSLPDSR